MINNRKEFDALIKAVIKTRGRKPYQETINETFASLSGDTVEQEKSKSSERRKIASRVMFVRQLFAEAPVTHQGAMAIYFQLNKQKHENIVSAIHDCVINGNNASAAAFKYHAKSSMIYRTVGAIQELHKIHKEWEKTQNDSNS